MFVEEWYDVIVVGAGHAGCEAALASSRRGMNTILFTVSMSSIAFMPCNPHIGGSSKGHLVREVDALGGEMGKNIDKTYLQSRMLNTSKGPAVHSLRAQADKERYSEQMRKTLQYTDNLTLRQGEVSDLIIEEEDGKLKVKGVILTSNAKYYAKSVILCTGTYLNARCVYGDVSENTGPNGLKAANFLTDSLLKYGIKMHRFKTGTPARIDGRTVDFSKMEEQPGDSNVIPFSFENIDKDISREQISCWLTYTNEETHKIIRDNIERSPLYNGDIMSTGPRYCPSIESKVMTFADKDRHHVFIEPEGEFTTEMYVGDMSSSLPEDVQYQMYRTVPGLENVKITRNAYAIEYDCILGTELKSSLEFKKIDNLFSAGQFNGSSGYEEAAAQGIIAGINAVNKIKDIEPLILKRSEAYIGVLIDDLVTKDTNEPYRMMTSRAEYRLLLRQDNADIRLSKIGYEVGLISEERYQHLLNKERQIVLEVERLHAIKVGANAKIQEFLASKNSSPLKTACTLADLMQRPELDYEALKDIDPEREELSDEVKEQVYINIKYEGYIERQMRQIKHFEKMEKRVIPADIDYDDVESLRIEAREKLKKFKPETIGMAGRIQGVSPADCSVLMVYLEKLKK
ncbi:MAG: tRNA uridine-5-carboxymethylaminomethyl(34) synthesis enzyme MnmG [Lachnospiraceae bacterium]|nr:tRNA uridine-5-carboxymethylaminomethyl(34) synthesis enzyme MnmG [Lachnospiraceae bacterium]